MVQENNVGESSAMDELIEVTRELRENLSRLIGAGRNLAGEQFGRVKETAGDLLQRGRERASSAATGTTDYVKEEPLKSILVAAAVGVVLGYLVKRR
jgi:ElaB/YqjD/DUF883 family membrane-anchored ribosome-binding protein